MESSDYDPYLIASIHLANAMIAESQNDKINNSNEFKEIETSVGNIEKQIDEIISINGLVTTAENALTSIRKKSVSIQKRIEKEIISLTGLTINIEN